MAAVDEWGALLPGQRIAGYEIKRKIGQGGFGIAYEAFHPALHIRAAIKEFFPRDMVARSGTAVSVREGESKGFYGRFLKRFIEEARAIHRLDHPNIVKVRHFEEANNTAYVVMNYIDGQNLKGWLENRRGSVSESDLQAIFTPVIDALGYVHGKNLLHRDISPLNIMVDQAGKPWLIDFGAFKEMWQEQPRRTSLLAANPAYAPPEQSDAGTGQDHGPFTDVFALAATMYEAIAGHKPASAASRMAQLAFRRADPLTPLEREAQVKCRPEVLRAVMRGLSLSPDDRPQSMAEFVADLGWLPSAHTEFSARPAPSPTKQIDTNTLPPLPPPSTAPPSRPSLQSFPPAPVIAPERRRRGKGLWVGISVAIVTAALTIGLWSMRGPISDKMAEMEYATIATSTDASAHEAFSKKHAGKDVARRAEQRAADLKRQQASVNTERQRQSRHAAAASEWERLKETSDERVLERFIEASGDAPVVAEARTRLANLKQQRETREASERQAQSERTRQARNATAAAEWERLKASEDEAAIERFLSAYGDTPSAAPASNRLAEIRRDKAARADAERQKKERFSQAANEWSRIKDSVDEKLIERFIEAHPDTPVAADARTRLVSLRKESEERRRQQQVSTTSPPASSLNRPLSAEQERALKPKDEFQECDLCPRMVVVPAGRFLMGSPPEEVGRFENEGPVHEVTIATPFAVGKFEVTFAEWEACANDGGCRSNPNPNDASWGRGTRPVINVSWRDAREFADWLSRKTGKLYRLLSESEWEYAARAGTRTKFHFGESDSDLEHYAWYKQNSQSRTQPVGQKRANAFGLHDLLGNAAEWVEDCERENYSVARKTESCGNRILRGGAWWRDPNRMRVAFREPGTDNVRSYNYLGFRLARTLDAPVTVALPSPAAPPKQAPVKPPNYPIKPITIVVPFAAGGSLDGIARLIAERLSKDLGQAILVENRSGANGLVGLMAAANASGDGYTLVISSVSTHIADQVVPAQPETATRLRSIGVLAQLPIIVVASSRTPASFPDFVRYLQSNGQRVTQANGGLGALSHLACQLLQRKLGVNNLAVPFRDEIEMLISVAGGHTNYACSTSLASVQLHTKSGAIKALAVISTERVPAMPDVPTIAELGVGDLDFAAWVGLFAPKSTPPEIVDYLGASLEKILDDAEVRKRLGDLGVLVPDRNLRAPQHLDARVAQDRARLPALLKTSR